MKRLTLRLTIALLTFIIGVVISVSWLSRRLQFPSESKPATGADKVEQDTTVSYRGVTFSYDSSLASEVKAAIVPALRLENETDKPDGVTPEHIAFTFAGPYGSRHESSFFKPEIHIYPVAEYKKALSVSKSYVKQFEDDMRALGNMLSDRPASWKDEIDVSFGMDGSQSFRIHVKYVNFNNGRGVMFLTQYDIEPSLINTDGLVYIFQGLTDDSATYVTATFPVTIPTLNLPKGYDATSYEGYHPPTYLNDFYGKDGEKKYQRYLEEMIRRIKGLESDKFDPNLQLFEGMLRSLSVHGQI